MYADKGSKKWLQIAVALAPDLLDQALRTAGVIDADDSVEWKSPLESGKFLELRDGRALQALSIHPLPQHSLASFWPPRGPVWDGLGVSQRGRLILVEAKAHIREAASPGCKATPHSFERIKRSLEQARGFYAPGATADWCGPLYQYANRLAFHYLLAQLNHLPSRLVFLDFLNATDMKGPETEAEWRGATRLIHALLELPADLTSFGVFHAYVDAGLVKARLYQQVQDSNLSASQQIS